MHICNFCFFFVLFLQTGSNDWIKIPNVSGKMSRCNERGVGALSFNNNKAKCVAVLARLLLIVHAEINIQIKVPINNSVYPSLPLPQLDIVFEDGLLSESIRNHPSGFELCIDFGLHSGDSSKCKSLSDSSVGFGVPIIDVARDHHIKYEFVAWIQPSAFHSSSPSFSKFVSSVSNTAHIPLLDEIWRTISKSTYSIDNFEVYLLVHNPNPSFFYGGSAVSLTVEYSGNAHHVICLQWHDESDLIDRNVDIMIEPLQVVSDDDNGTALLVYEQKESSIHMTRHTDQQCRTLIEQKSSSFVDLYPETLISGKHTLKVWINDESGSLIIMNEVEYHTYNSKTLLQPTSTSTSAWDGSMREVSFNASMVKQLWSQFSAQLNEEYFNRDPKSIVSSLRVNDRGVKI
jgi:hypothetical protein